MNVELGWDDLCKRVLTLTCRNFWWWKHWRVCALTRDRPTTSDLEAPRSPARDQANLPQQILLCAISAKNFLKCKLKLDYPQVQNLLILILIFSPFDLKPWILFQLHPLETYPGYTTVLECDLESRVSCRMDAIPPEVWDKWRMSLPHVTSSFTSRPVNQKSLPVLAGMSKGSRLKSLLPEGLCWVGFFVCFVCG